MPSTLAFTEGLHYWNANAMSARTCYAGLFYGKSIAQGTITSTTGLAGLTEETGTAYARASVALGTDALGIIAIPQISFNSGSATNWHSTVRAWGMCSAATAGVVIQVWDLGGRTGNTTIGSQIVTGLSVSSGVGPLTPGQGIYGTGIPANTTILSIQSTTQLTLSQAATATGTAVSLAFDWSMAPANTSLVIQTLYTFTENPGGI